MQLTARHGSGTVLQASTHLSQFSSELGLIITNNNWAIPIPYADTLPILYWNTPGTAGGPGGRDRTLAIKTRKTAEKKHIFFLKKIKFTPKKYFFFHISSSYAKILGEKLFRTWEIPRSG